MPLYCTIRRMPAARQESLQTVMSYRDNLWYGADGPTNNPVAILGDVIFYGLLPAKSLLRANVNMDIARCKTSALGNKPLLKRRRKRSQHPLL